MKAQEVYRYCEPRFLGFLGDLNTIRWFAQTIYLTDTDAHGYGRMVSTRTPSLTKIEFRLLSISSLSILCDSYSCIFEPNEPYFGVLNNEFNWPLVMRTLERHPNRGTNLNRSIYLFDNFCVDNTEENCLWSPYKLTPSWQALNAMEALPQPSR